MISDVPAEALMAWPVPQEPVEKSPELSEFWANSRLGNVRMNPKTLKIFVKVVGEDNTKPAGGGLEVLILLDIWVRYKCFKLEGD